MGEKGRQVGGDLAEVVAAGAEDGEDGITGGALEGFNRNAELARVRRRLHHAERHRRRSVQSDIGKT